MRGGISDLELVCLVYLFLIVPIYVVSMLAALFCRSPEDDGNRRTTSRSLRSFANLLPIAVAFAFLVYGKVVTPLLPHYYTDAGFFLTWGCILAPLPLALVVTFCSPLKFYRVASSWRWVAFYGVGAGILVTILLFK